jgi:hypothetical protein
MVLLRGATSLSATIRSQNQCTSQRWRTTSSTHQPGQPSTGASHDRGAMAAIAWAWDSISVRASERSRVIA